MSDKVDWGEVEQRALNIATMYGMAAKGGAMHAMLEGQRGTPVQQMQAHLRSLLQRLRLTVPFDIDKHDLMEQCMSKGFWRDDRRAENVRLAMKMEDLAFFQTVADNNTGTLEGVFWCRYDDKVPAPFEAMAAFIVPSDVPFLTELHAWLVKATELNVAIMTATKLVTGYANAMKHPLNIQSHWPELWPFVANVGAGNKTFDKAVPAVPPHLAATARIDRSIAANITNMLATATLLPDAQPTAWVGFHK